MKHPVGFCQCGCGKKTTIPIKTDRRAGQFRGEPIKYIDGHHMRKQTPEYIVNEDGCWIWNRHLNPKGYGTKYDKINKDDTKHKSAHRYYYEKYKGKIPDGLEIDHLCRNRACVNPDHLEAVTDAVNSQRGLKAKLTPQKVVEIRDLFKKGMSKNKLSQLYEVARITIRKVVDGNTWRNI
jgi:hypothetical protein